MKRFTETNKWRDAWFRRLSAGAKLVWIYLTENCDSVGMIEIDFGLLSADCGMKITPEHLQELNSRLQKISEGRFFIPKFIPFQYGELTDRCPPHKTILRLIEIHQLRKEGLVYLHPNGSEYKPEVKAEGPPPEKPAGTITPAMQIYDAYPRKIARPEALRAIHKALKKISAVELLKKTLEYAAARQGQNERYTPHPASWFNAERYNDDPETWKDAGPASNGKSPSVYELTKVIEAKTKIAQNLKNRFAAEGPLTTDWTDPEKKDEYRTLRGEIAELEKQLAGRK